MRTSIACALILGLAHASVHAAGVVARDGATIAAGINRFMDEAEQGAAATPGLMSGTLLVELEGHVIVKRTFGYANLEWRVPTAEDTKYLLASVSKPIVATAIMRLRDQGRLSLDDSICKFVPEAPETWSPVTLRHLLSHTSGIAHTLHTARPSPNGKQEWRDPFSYREKSSPRAILARYYNAPLEFPPGEKFRYNNLGYVALGVVIESLCHQSLEAALTELVFQPAGMTSSGVYDAEKVYPHWASGYVFPVGEGSAYRPEYMDPSWMYTAGGLYSTADDLRRFLQALRTGKLLPPESLREMWQPLPVTQRHEPLPGYALGWDVGEVNGRKAIWHDGALHGANNSLIWYPDGDLVIVWLSNGPRSGVDPTPANGMRARPFDDVVPELVFKDDLPKPEPKP